MIARSDRSSTCSRQSETNLVQLRFDSSDAAAQRTVGALRQSRRFSHFPAALLFELYDLRTNSGGFAIFGAIRPVSSLVPVRRHS
jgi:hypothetical protein